MQRLAGPATRSCQLRLKPALAILPACTLTAAGGDGALAATSGTPMPQFMGGVTGGDLGGTGIAGMGGAAGSGSAMGDTGLIPDLPADLPWG